MLYREGPTVKYCVHIDNLEPLGPKVAIITFGITEGAFCKIFQKDSTSYKAKISGERTEFHFIKNCCEILLTILLLTSCSKFDCFSVSSKRLLQKSNFLLASFKKGDLMGRIYSPVLVKVKPKSGEKNG